nr:hypothetical protein [Oscillospiraceae bacterium]
MIIRRFKNEDSVELADVIAKTLRTTNIKDYSVDYIENDIRFLTATAVEFYKKMGYDYKNGIAELDDEQ